MFWLEPFRCVIQYKYQLKDYPNQSERNKQFIISLQIWQHVSAHSEESRESVSRPEFLYEAKSS
jgi:hypothetical protein